MRKVMGLMTEDFRLYHDLVAELKARDIPFVSLSFSRRIPENVGVIVTSPKEVERVGKRNVVAVEDIGTAIARALQILQGKTRWEEVLVGIDPGAEPGVAVVGDGRVLSASQANSPEDVAKIVKDALGAFPSSRRHIRVGHGDRTNRNRILNALAREELPAEIVDEAGTTDRTQDPDIDAAIKIAFVAGVRAK